MASRFRDICLPYDLDEKQTSPSFGLLQLSDVNFLIHLAQIGQKRHLTGVEKGKIKRLVTNQAFILISDALSEGYDVIYKENHDCLSKWQKIDTLETDHDRLQERYQYAIEKITLLEKLITALEQKAV